MKKIVTIISIIFIASIFTPASAYSSILKKTIELKKYPRRHKDTDPMHQRIPTAMICCYVDSENGIEQLDISDIETYEIWDIEDTTPVVVYEDQYSFADYILSNPPSYLIKLYSPDYIYIGRVE